jgi:uncharacterized protein YndB with AHSA1/START domain
VTVTNVTKDPEHLTMTITSRFHVDVERVWKLWEDPRRLERWWGPPMYPATFVEHDLAVGATVTYYMTGPEGDRHHGWWRILAVDPPHRLEFEDGFADEHGDPAPDLPTTTTRVRLEAEEDGGTEMSIETVFPSVEAMEHVLAMGAEEGMKLALGQIDDILRETEES